MFIFQMLQVLLTLKINEVLTRSEHTSIHNKEKEIIRNSQNGRIIGVVKREELLENPEVDNQQPSQPLTKLEGSETNS